MGRPSENCDVVIIGAGPAGALAAKRLADEGVSVILLEKSRFPRFVIGESLLPQSMAFLERAGLIDVLDGAGFQQKTGANFSDGTRYSSIDFSDKFTKGWARTWQVPREKFDSLLAAEAERAGTELHFECDVESVEFAAGTAVVSGHSSAAEFRINCRFVVDASGYGRVLPRLLDLDRPSDFPVREALFTHVEDNLAGTDFDRNKILIAVHPEIQDIWYWLIPFAAARASVGVVAPARYLAGKGENNEDILHCLIDEMPDLKRLLRDAKDCRPAGRITGYSAGVSRLTGPGFALLGNAGEFLDPVFSSGVTIAFKSADLLIDPLMRELAGETVDWEKDFSNPLKRGVDCFRTFVEAWYDGSLQKIIFNPPEGDNMIRKMIVSVLAGYAWDDENPFVTRGRHYLDVVAAQC
ncbi:MAG: NAD(P)/FAD-dependent oxidoreductase [Alphaproteobacteria bacterium]|nr:MAG: NAD(P)/FAD-dependent oxidoreductase [Alphaproteobacteria bacterium]